MPSEARLLRLSASATIVLAGIAVLAGWWTGSTAILFDGLYGLIDAVMTVLAVLVAGTIGASNAADAKGQVYNRHFTAGFWHFEPLLLCLNGTMLLGATVFALGDALVVLLATGRAVAFGPAAAYCAMATLCDVAMALVVRRANRSLQSRLIAADAQSWGVTALLGLALLGSFILGNLVAGTQLAWVAPYIDPVAQILLCLIIIPVPLRMTLQALLDILRVTPRDLLLRVDAVGDAIVARHGFVSHRAFVVRVGRGTQIEMNFIVPAGLPPRPLEAWDAVRDAINDALDIDSPDLWLTIVFTTDPDWAW